MEIIENRELKYRPQQPQLRLDAPVALLAAIPADTKTHEFGHTVFVCGQFAASSTTQVYSAMNVALFRNLRYAPELGLLPDWRSLDPDAKPSMESRHEFPCSPRRCSTGLDFFW